MGKIVQLPDELSNKIAAGEVVERPASVVKELLENSVDANSQWIKIELEEAGLRSIKIIDDGDGIDPDDCETAFFRHATSKIEDEFDLFRVKTLGFRGEALASISSVSQLTLRTSTGDQSGNELVVHGGDIKDKQKHTKRKGTEIIVENLFYNTPARLKYLKTIHTELGHVTDTINKMALSHPDIRFECYHNGKRIFFSPGNGNLLQVIQQIYGKKIAQNMLQLEDDSLDYKVSGYICKPEVTRSNRNFISLIVNGRFIKNPVINKAIFDGYHTFLPIGRYPIVILQIEMDPYLVDVNVHPAKTEVRFSKEKELFDVVKQSIYDVLHKQRLIPSGAKKEKPKSTQTTLSFDPMTRQDKTHDEKEQLEDIGHGFHIQESFTSHFDDADNHPVENGQKPPYPNDIGSESEELDEETERMPLMYPIGQLHGTYILAQNEKGLYMIDQHAAQERIKYEFFKKKLGDPPNEVQALSVPISFEFTGKEAIIIEEHKEAFERVGLFLEPFGDYSYIVRSYPSWFPNGEEEQIIRDMVEDLIQNRSIDIEKIREEAAILMSCKRSIKANHYLNHQEMEYLLSELRTCHDPFTCPHGRPIVIHFSEYELQRMFKRIM
ncbi:DNA mismatch repair endonuclease MutL [Tenuibacillus multivorans]|uniref:DNA mismatch repair protein MutL n=1 Tax=Tenuibacillus multivorans TaxID=237069 RepID=A0A1G9XSD8_9BACI|nr:DNA mismatch repair endonuclease MutL [Tenuibacillus multivorans]GEL75798.1 DNA mismatch repair protein MutL [Tenuibacillus multivorans]SDM99714.1 DNA mismatch repair protein MutL [Tenuibacillus multivorans]